MGRAARSGTISAVSESGENAGRTLHRSATMLLTDDGAANLRPKHPQNALHQSTHSLLASNNEGAAMQNDQNDGTSRGSMRRSRQSMGRARSGTIRKSSGHLAFLTRDDC